MRLGNALTQCLITITLKSKLDLEAPSIAITSIIQTLRAMILSKITDPDLICQLLEMQKWFL